MYECLFIRFAHIEFHTIYLAIKTVQVLTTDSTFFYHTLTYIILYIYIFNIRKIELNVALASDVILYNVISHPLSPPLPPPHPFSSLFLRIACSVGVHTTVLLQMLCVCCCVRICRIFTSTLYSMM